MDLNELPGSLEPGFLFCQRLARLWRTLATVERFGAFSRQIFPGMGVANGLL